MTNLHKFEKIILNYAKKSGNNLNVNSQEYLILSDLISAIRILEKTNGDENLPKLLVDILRGVIVSSVGKKELNTYCDMYHTFNRELGNKPN